MIISGPGSGSGSDLGSGSGLSCIIIRAIIKMTITIIIMLFEP